MEKYFLIGVPLILLLSILKQALFTKHTRQDGLRARWERNNSYLKVNGYFNCAYCGKWVSRENMQLDHVWPLHKGGKNWWINLVPACTACNQSKKAKLKFAYLFLGYTYYPRLILRVLVYGTIYILALINLVYTSLHIAISTSVLYGVALAAIFILLGIAVFKLAEFRRLFFSLGIVSTIIAGGGGFLLYAYKGVLFGEYRGISILLIFYLVMTVSNVYRNIFRILPGKNF